MLLRKSVRLWWAWRRLAKLQSDLAYVEGYRARNLAYGRPADHDQAAMEELVPLVRAELERAKWKVAEAIGDYHGFDRSGAPRV